MKPAKDRKPPLQQHYSPYLKVYRTDEGWVFASRKDDTDYEVVLRGGKPKPDAVVICAIYPDYERESGEGALVAIHQYRSPIGQYIWELPAGLIDEGESPEESAAREFKEETGMDFEYKESGPLCYATPGFTDESAVIVYGYASGTPSKSNQVHDEDMDIHLMERLDVERMLNSGDPVGVRLALCGKLFLCGAFD